MSWASLILVFECDNVFIVICCVVFMGKDSKLGILLRIGVDVSLTGLILVGIGNYQKEKYEFK